MSDDFPYDWKLAPLEDCLDALIDYRGKTPTKTTFGIPLVTAKIIKGGRIEEPQEFIAEHDFDEWMQRGLPLPGDVVMTTEAPLGEIAQLGDRKVALAQRVITLRGKAGFLDNTFLRFLMQSAFVQEQLEGRASGTTVMGIRQRELRGVSLVIPPYYEQRAIARVLGALDDKIELNRRMDRTLEELARALFRAWFVDFEPVIANAAGRVSAHLSPALARLFPDSFQDSELGRIPKGWRVHALGDVLNVKHGYAFAGEFFADKPPGDILLTPGNFAIGGGFKESKLKYYTGMVPEDYVLSKGDLLLTMTDLSKASDTLGYPAIIPPAIAGQRFLHNQRLGKVIVTDRDFVSHLFLYQVFRTEAYRNEILASATGTTVMHTAPVRIMAYKTVFAPIDVHRAFNQIVHPLYEMIHHHQAESQTLAVLRDTLLPRLLSGEVRVKQVQRVLERA